MPSSTRSFSHKPIGKLHIGDGNHPTTFEEFLEFFTRMNIETTPDSGHLLKQCLADMDDVRDQSGEETLVVTSPSQLQSTSIGTGFLQGCYVNKIVQAASEDRLICCQFLSAAVMCTKPTRLKKLPRKMLIFVSRTIINTTDGKPYHFCIDNSKDKLILGVESADPRRIFSMDQQLVFAARPEG